MWLLFVNISILALFIISCENEFEFNFIDNVNTLNVTLAGKNNFLDKRGLQKVAYKRLNSSIYVEVINYGWVCKVFEPKVAQFEDTILISYKIKTPFGNSCADEIMPVVFKYTIPVKQNKDYIVYFVKPDQEGLWKLLWGD